MAIEIFVLSVLRSGPAHGYELRRRVQRPALGPISTNTLYAVLRRFEAVGAVTHEVEAQEGRPARKVYTITDHGRTVLDDLVSTLPETLARSTEEFMLRLSFFGELPTPARRQVLAARAAVLDAGIAQVRELVATNADTPERRWRTLAMTRLLEDLLRERDWITSIGHLVDEEDR